MAFLKENIIHISRNTVLFT